MSSHLCCPGIFGEIVDIPVSSFYSRNMEATPSSKEPLPSSWRFYNPVHAKTISVSSLKKRLGDNSLMASGYYRFFRNLETWLQLTSEVFKTDATRYLRPKPSL